jgi:hypothetical protein
VNRFREMLPFGEVPIRLMIRGREGGKPPPTSSLDDPGTILPPPQRSRKPPVKAKPVRPRRNERKPHPKPAAKRGPARGTRPHR